MPEKRELPRDGRRSPAPWQPRSSLSAWPRAEESHGKTTSTGRCQPNLRKPANKLGPCREPAGNTQRLFAILLGFVCSSGNVPLSKVDTLRRLRCSVSLISASDRRSTAAATSQKFPWKDHLGAEKRPPPGGCIGHPRAARQSQHPSVRPGRSECSRAAAISLRPPRERADRSRPFGDRPLFLCSGTPYCVLLHAGSRFARDC